MKIHAEQSDTAILAEIGARLARARLNGNRTQAQLARAAGVSKRTVERIEAGAPTQLGNLIRVLRALGLVENLERLLPAPLPSPIEQLKLRGKVRARASRGAAGAPDAKWTWDDDR